MKLDGDSGFHRMALETILAMCSNDINGKRILKIEGFLSLTVESGEIFCLVIKEELDGTEDEEDGSFEKQYPSPDDYLRQKLDEIAEGEIILCQDSEKSVLSPSYQSENDLQFLEDHVTAETAQSQQEEVYYCSLCEKLFKNVHSLERHVKLKHSSGVDLRPDDLTELFSDKPPAVSVADCKWQIFEVNESKECASSSDPVNVQEDTPERNDNSELLCVDAAALWEEMNSENKAEFEENVAADSEIPTSIELLDVSRNSLANLKQETADQTMSALYNCPECQKSFKIKSAFNSHMSDEHGCFDAGREIGAQVMHKHRSHKLFPTSEQLFRHCRRSRKSESCSKVGQSMYKCVYHGKVYATYGELRSHQSVHHRAKSFVCRDCNMSFTSQGDQIYHRMRYHRKRTCSLCQLVCIGLVSFTEHVRSCHPGIPVYKVNKHLVCEFCSGTFGDEKHLNDHIQSKHLGLVHTCEVCGKVLGTAETLRIHCKLHEAETYRTCDVCGRQFGRLASLMEHMRSKHPENVPEKYRCSFKCLHCGLLFTRRHTLRRHMENKHEGKTFACDVCGKIFRSKRYVVRHKKAHHHAGVGTVGEFNKSKAVLSDRQPVGDERNSFSFLNDGTKSTNESNESLH